MNAVFIALAILVAFILAVVGPWVLLRKLEREDAGPENGHGPEPIDTGSRDPGSRDPGPRVRDPRKPHGDGP